MTIQEQIADIIVEHSLDGVWCMANDCSWSYNHALYGNQVDQHAEHLADVIAGIIPAAKEPDEPQVTKFKREYGRDLQLAKADALNSASEAFNKECLKFQSSWGSNPEDLAKLEVLGKTITWLEQRGLKYLDTLPRTIVLRDEYKNLSDGAIVEIEGQQYTHRSGFGLFTNRNGEDIVARDYIGHAVLINNNL